MKVFVFGVKIADDSPVGLRVHLLCVEKAPVSFHRHFHILRGNLDAFVYHSEDGNFKCVEWSRGFPKDNTPLTDVIIETFKTYKLQEEYEHIH